MSLDPVWLSRLQWAWVIAWHILLPAFTVGVASYIAVLEGFYFFTRNEVWFRTSGFWTRIFAVSFGMGVVSGIIMPFQFGTNWSRFTDATADVISPMMAYEGLMAFFLESSFLGVLLFGRKLVPNWAHFFAAVMVAFGTLLSSFWILATNSWMQTPQGYKVVDGRFLPADWTDLIPDLNRQPHDHMVTKHTPGAFTRTDLEAHLRSLEVTQVVVAGVATRTGVAVTANTASALGFNVTLATDAMTDLHPDAHTWSVTRVFPRIGETGTTQDIINLLERSA